MFDSRSRFSQRIGPLLTDRPILSARMASVAFFAAFFFTFCLAQSRTETPAPEKAWTLALPGPPAGSPTLLGRAEEMTGLLVTLHNGTILHLDREGKRVKEMSMDRPAAAAALSADLSGHGDFSIVGADLWGSVYAFDSLGRRMWKYEREDKTGGGYNYLTAFDLDGDGAQEILMSSARGNLYALRGNGRLQMEIQVTRYRVSAPAVADINGDGMPELIFGNERSEIYCLGSWGEYVWGKHMPDFRFGRSLPVLADADGDGRTEAYISTSFVGQNLGLFQLDASSGDVLWKAPSRLQVYNSTALADLNGDGLKEILYGDKNTMLYAVDARGKPLWERQLPGRGIFFSPVIFEWGNARKPYIFQIVRDSGPDGHALFLLSPEGKLLSSWSLEGGGAGSPLLGGWAGDRTLRLFAVSTNGRLSCFRIPDTSSSTRILWGSTRFDSALSGRETGPANKKILIRPPAGTDRKQSDAIRRAAAPGTTVLELPPMQEGQRAHIRITSPDGVLRVKIHGPGFGPDASFDSSRQGDYRVQVQIQDLASGRLLKEQAYLFTQSSGNGRSAETASGGSAELRQLDNPWEDPISGRRFTEPATAASVPGRITLKMLGNEYESAAIALTNASDSQAVFRLSCSDFRDSNGKQVAARQVLELREVPGILPESTGAPAEDVLPLLGQGQLVWMSPRETRKIWLTINSRSLPSGQFRARLTVGNLRSTRVPLEAEILLNVYPFRLPDNRVYRHGDWLYLAGIKDDELFEATLRDALDHGTNVFHIPALTFQADRQKRLVAVGMEMHDKIVRRLRGKALFLVGGSVNLTWPKDYDPPESLRESAFADAVRLYGEHMKALGLAYSDWAFYTMDEPGLMGRDASYEKWMLGVKRVKAADPKVQIYANPAGGARAEILREIAPWVDIWQPDLHLVRDEPEALSEIFRKGQYWHYEAPADQRHLDPLGYYRMKPWVAFQMGMTGGGYWVYSSSPYWLFDPLLGTEYGTVYTTDRGPVTTKRWEASRDGMEDFELLWQLRLAARKEGSSRGAEALGLLQDAVEFVTRGQEKVSDISRQVYPYTPDYKTWMQYRGKLIAALCSLSGAALQPVGP